MSDIVLIVTYFHNKLLKKKMCYLILLKVKCVTKREREGKFYSALSHYLFVGLWPETRKERSTWIEPNQKQTTLSKRQRKRL